MNLMSALTGEDRTSIASICSRIIGWSDQRQYGFFKALLEAKPEAKSLLMVGVYYGRDIAFIQDILARYHPGRVLGIVGVDRFSTAPCADWPHWATSWEHLTNGMPAPDFDKAYQNVAAGRDCIALFKDDDETFLARAVGLYDVIYLDASHDEASVARQLGQVRKLCNGPQAIICGDDFSNLNGWGVKTAVEKAFTKFELFEDWVWYGKAEDLK